MPIHICGIRFKRNNLKVKLDIRVFIIPNDVLCPLVDVFSKSQRFDTIAPPQISPL